MRSASDARADLFFSRPRPVKRFPRYPFVFLFFQTCRFVFSPRNSTAARWARNNFPVYFEPPGRDERFCVYSSLRVALFFLFFAYAIPATITSIMRIPVFRFVPFILNNNRNPVGSDPFGCRPRIGATTIL